MLFSKSIKQFKMNIFENQQLPYIFIKNKRFMYASKKYHVVSKQKSVFGRKYTPNGV